MRMKTKSLMEGYESKYNLDERVKPGDDVLIVLIVLEREGEEHRPEVGKSKEGEKEIEKEQDGPCEKRKGVDE